MQCLRLETEQGKVFAVYCVWRAWLRCVRIYRWVVRIVPFFNNVKQSIKDILEKKKGPQKRAKAPEKVRRRKGGKEKQ